MATATVTNGRSAPRPARRKFAEHGVFGMALFVFAEAMLFMGFISAFVIAENGAPPGTWPPPGQPRLPVATTALNTVALLASGVALFLAHRAFRRAGPRPGLAAMRLAFLLGTFFVAFQGFEWARLLAQGLTLTSSLLGAFFYLIVGTHALHAVGALVGMGFAWRSMTQGTLTASRLGAVLVFWSFVVLMWPLIFLLVYL